MGTGPLDLPAPDLFTTLRVDAMYFREASKQRDCAQKCQPEIEAAISSQQQLQERFDNLDRENQDDREGLAIQLEGKDYAVGAAYAPMIAALASVHIFAAAAAEAHINDRAKAHLSGTCWESFARITVESKWLFFPRIAGCGAFDAGAEPHQGLVRLFRRRNALLHYKPRREPWSQLGVPEFLQDLGLTLNAAGDSRPPGKS